MRPFAIAASATSLGALLLSVLTGAHAHAATQSVSVNCASASTTAVTMAEGDELDFTLTGNCLSVKLAVGSVTGLWNDIANVPADGVWASPVNAPVVYEPTSAGFAVITFRDPITAQVDVVLNVTITALPAPVAVPAPPPPPPVVIGLNANGGTCSASSLTGAVNSWPALPGSGQCSRTGSGWRLMGWNPSADGSGSQFAPGQQIQLTGDNTLYAIWSNRLSAPTLTANSPSYDSSILDPTVKEFGDWTTTIRATPAPSDAYRPSSWEIGWQTCPVAGCPAYDPLASLPIKETLAGMPTDPTLERTITLGPHTPSSYLVYARGKSITGIPAPWAFTVVDCTALKVNAPRRVYTRALEKSTDMYVAGKGLTSVNWMRVGWDASTSPSWAVSGYDVYYRRITASGPTVFTRVASTNATTFTIDLKPNLTTPSTITLNRFGPSEVGEFAVRAHGLLPTPATAPASLSSDLQAGRPVTWKYQPLTRPQVEGAAYHDDQQRGVLFQVSVPESQAASITDFYVDFPYVGVSFWVPVELFEASTRQGRTYYTLIFSDEVARSVSRFDYLAGALFGMGGFPASFTVTSVNWDAKSSPSYVFTPPESE